MTNYMGVNRLKRIIHNYLINVKGIDEKKFKKDSLFERYHKGRGCEWLNCGCGEYTIKLFVDGSKAKDVTIVEYRHDESTEEDVYYDCITTYYDDDFNPLPNATWFSSSVAGIKARKEGGHFFIKGNNEAEANKYVCFDIAKKQQSNESEFIEGFRQDPSTYAL
ncbi:MAG: hypothetical protein K2J79_11735 [Ruminiclostridium sp.]|nr:hypothetical protein [Ruminiclostridium sp.]